MILFVDDANIKARTRRLPNGRRELVVNYPREDHYERLVRGALAGLIRPDGPAEPDSETDTGGEARK